MTAQTLGVELTAPFAATTDGRMHGLGDTYTDQDGNKYIFVQASGAITAAGYVCTIDETYQATMVTTSNDAEGDRIGVPLAAFSDDDYGWLQVGGVCSAIRVSANAAANVPLNTTATAGQLDDDAAVASMRVRGLYLTTANGGSAATAAGILFDPYIVDSDADAVLLVGTQTVAGDKTFSGTNAHSGANTFNSSVLLADGTAATDKVGFYGTTPIVQRASASQTAVTAPTFVTAAGTAAPEQATSTPGIWGFATSTQIIRLIANHEGLRAWAATEAVMTARIRNDIKAYGLIKGGA